MKFIIIRLEARHVDLVVLHPYTICTQCIHRST
jgi:hypothetical protein